MATAAEKKAAVDLLVEEGVIVENNGEVTEPTKEELDRELALSNWIADLGGADDAAVIVYRVRDKDNKPVYIDSLGAQEMDGPTVFQKLKNEYGGGKFRIQLRGEGRIQKTQTVEIEPPPKGTELQQNNGGMGAADVASLVKELKGDGSNSNIELMMQMMQQQNAQFQQMITTIVSGMNQKPDTPTAPSMTEIIAAVSQLKDMSTPTTTEPTELILKGVELVNAIRGDEGGGGEANMYTLLNSAVKEFGGALASLPSPPNVPPQNAQATQPMRVTAEDSTQPQQIETQPTETQQPQPQQIVLQSEAEVPEQLKSFEPFVNYMVTKAAAGKDTELYADVLIDEMGEQNAGEWIGTADGRDTLARIFTQVQPYRAWFDEVGAIIAEMLAGEPDAPPVDPDAERPDNDPDVTSQADGDDKEGQPSAAGTDDPSTIGDTAGAGGDSANAPIDGEARVISKD